MFHSSVLVRSFAFCLVFTCFLCDSRALLTARQAASYLRCFFLPVCESLGTEKFRKHGTGVVPVEQKQNHLWQVTTLSLPLPLDSISGPPTAAVPKGSGVLRRHSEWCAFNFTWSLLCAPYLRKHSFHFEHLWKPKKILRTNMLAERYKSLH